MRRYATARACVGGQWDPVCSGTWTEGRAVSSLTRRKIGPHSLLPRAPAGAVRVVRRRGVPSRPGASPVVAPHCSIAHRRTSGAPPGVIARRKARGMAAQSRTRNLAAPPRAAIFRRGFGSLRRCRAPRSAASALDVGAARGPARDSAEEDAGGEALRRHAPARTRANHALARRRATESTASAARASAAAGSRSRFLAYRPRALPTPRACLRPRGVRRRKRPNAPARSREVAGRRFASTVRRVAGRGRASGAASAFDDREARRAGARAQKEDARSRVPRQRSRLRSQGASRDVAAHELTAARRPIGR